MLNEKRAKHARSADNNKIRCLLENVLGCLLENVLDCLSENVSESVFI
jgi:hypothetical protein